MRAGVVTDHGGFALKDHLAVRIQLEVEPAVLSSRKGQ
jgi:hypothetical protein